VGRIRPTGWLANGHTARPDTGQLGPDFPGLAERHAEACGHGGWARESGDDLPDPFLPAMRSGAKATKREGSGAN
jgi:hypothetical protein